MSDFLTVTEIANELGVTTRTIRNYISEGKLKGSKVGGQWRFLKSELYKFVGDIDSFDTQELINTIDNEFRGLLVINIPIITLEKMDTLKEKIIKQYNNVYEGSERKLSYQLKSSKNAQIIIQGNYDYLLSFGNWIFKKIELYELN
ncbi:helix-turn-helix domain-containing protein [Vagococcus entomophilus]|uniref:Helix-turn-helix domain-containing protein n=1 Tax=Vagococcus entomophilus TaxID=1160095 RepID=A0A430AHS8_9ENTE|nr:helix-turn-helix domain-containing protein [Vagococcus entomophilus]RSU07327.1 hypothetical protein CBF30_08740 [Vagococcus entomophilus]